MFDVNQNKFIFCSQYIGADDRGIRDRNRTLLKKLKEEIKDDERDRLINELILNNRPLVWFVVKNFVKFYDCLEDENEFNDVISQGYLYLCEIIQGYNYSKDQKNPVGFFGVNLYYRLLGKIEYYIKRKKKRIETIEYLEIEPIVEEIPRIINPVQMEADYILYKLDKILFWRERNFIMTIYEFLKRGQDISEAIKYLADKNDLTTQYVYQIRNKAIRRINRYYKPFFWDLED